MFQTRDEESSWSAENSVDPIVGLITSSKEKLFWNCYVPKKRLGSGSYGGVFAATRLEDNLSVAVKVVRRQGAQFVMRDGESVPKEAVTLKQLSHVDGVIKLLDWLDTGDKILFVMERPNNSTDLRTFLKTHGRFSEEVTRFMMTQLISTVNLMREANVLHRDLKLENILVERDTLKLKVIDFGLTSTFTSLSQTFRTCMGTSRYLPPEMFKKNRFIAGPGVVWALGVIAFKLLTGLSPFDDEEDTIDGSPTYPDYLSKCCIAFVDSCLNIDSDQRISLDELLSDFWMMKQASISARIPTILSISEDRERDLPSSPEYSEFTPKRQYKPVGPKRRKVLESSETNPYPRSSNHPQRDNQSSDKEIQVPLKEANYQMSCGVSSKPTAPLTAPTELLTLSQLLNTPTVEDFVAAEALCFLRFG